MAAPQLVVRNSAGTITFDSRLATEACVLDVLTVAAGATGTYTYPLFPGRSAVTLLAYTQVGWGVTVDTALGYPRVTVSTLPFDRTIVVFAT
jgi:hypothetical protein